MTEHEENEKNTDLAQSENQPPALRDLLSSINSSRRQSSLYGVDHPNTLRTVGELSSVVDEFLSNFERATLVFTRKAIIANEHTYTASSDSQELFQRLRARGVMALTIVGSVDPRQIASFLTFLNTEPNTIRTHGGASSYLRKQAVTKIVATDAVYTSEGGADYLDDDADLQVDCEVDNIDGAVGAAINWLSRQKDEESEEEAAPRLPILDILSQPDQAARLIREAVTKLHASRRENTSGEIASEVVNDLKELACSDKEKWDNSIPQIRKAMSKLPKGMRPEISGFTEENEPDGEAEIKNDCPVAEISKVEMRVAEMLEETRNLSEVMAFPAPDVFGSLFGARADGLLSSWRRELQPSSVMESSGKTLETLMIWETRVGEHERIVRALAELIPRAVEMGDIVSARIIAACIIKEMRREEALNWRSTNAKSALATLDPAMLKPLIEASLASGDAVGLETASVLVEILPNLALENIGLLGSNGTPIFIESLRRGIVASGQGAIGLLGKLLREEAGALRDMALEVLIDMQSARAIHEISIALDGADIEFLVCALKRLPSVRIPQVTVICTAHLTHSSPDVRYAALEALGELGDESAVPTIVRIALKGSLIQKNIAEKVEAAKALGRMDCPEALDCLQKMASKRPLIGRGQYEAVRLAAEQALSEAHERKAGVYSRAG